MTVRLALFEALLLAAVLLVAARLATFQPHHTSAATASVDTDGTARAVATCVDAALARIERR